MKAVMTQSMELAPFSSPTIVGRAVPRMVWFRAESSMESISATKTSTNLASLAGALLRGSAERDFS